MNRRMAARAAAIVGAAFALAIGLGMAPADGIVLRAQNVEIADGGTYFQPMNSATNYIPLYSFQKTTYTIRNKSAADVTINSIVFEPQGNGLPYEWHLLQFDDLKNPPLVVKDQVIPAGKSWDFIIMFFPVHGEERSAKVTITYDGDKKLTFTVKGKGRPKDTKFFEHADLVWDGCWGGDTTDEMPTGVVADEAGNVYFSGNVTQVINKFAHDVFVGRVNADGTLAWAKGWSGKFQDYQRDSGQNAETGGAAGAIAYADGHVYLALSHSPSQANSTFHAVILKVNAETGEIAWQKAWGPKGDIKLVKESSEAYGLDVRDGVVYVAGTAEDVLFLALKADTGEVIVQKTIDVEKGKVDRGYAVRADGKGGVYLTGLTNGRGLLMRIGDAATAEPKLTWVKKISMGVGSNINALDVDADGNAYLSLDRRGASTGFSAMRVSADGAVVWAKTFGDEKGPNNNTHVVRVAGEHLYVGGRLAYPWHDTQWGDALLVRLKKDDGALDWAGFYYGGKGAEEMAEHRIKGIAVTKDGHLIVGGQTYTGTNNHGHFWGHWYDATTRGKLTDYKGHSSQDFTEKATMADPAEGFGVKNANELESFNGWIDLKGLEKPLGEGLGVPTWQPLRENGGNAPDGETFIMKLKLK